MGWKALKKQKSGCLNSYSEKAECQRNRPSYDETRRPVSARLASINEVIRIPRSRIRYSHTNRYARPYLKDYEDSSLSGCLMALLEMLSLFLNEKVVALQFHALHCRVEMQSEATDPTRLHCLLY